MKKILAICVILFSLFLFSCDEFIFPFFTTSPNQTTLPISRPNTATGTITVLSHDFAAYPLHDSDSYGLEIDDYNALLVHTRDLIRQANVSITATLYEERDLYPWGPSTSIRAISKGSGIIYMQDAEFYYAVTNYHVVDPKGLTPGYEIKTLEDEGYQEAFLVAGSDSLDLAVIRFRKNSRTDVELIDIQTRAFTKFNEGELVLAVGNPQSLENNVTFGVYIGLETISHVNFPVIMHNAPIHEGSSGGALVDVDGNLLGVNTWGVDQEDTAFAIPNAILYMFLANEGLLPT